MAGSNVENLKSMQFTIAKRWQGLFGMCGAGVFVLGVLVLYLNQMGVVLALAGVVLAGVGEYYRWKSDSMKYGAEMTLRRFEMHESLGWAISQHELREMLGDGPDSLMAAADAPEVRAYFASGSGIGLLRMMENLEESAFWSKHLAKEMAKWLFLATAAVIALAIWILVLALQYTAAQGGADRVGQVVIAMLVLLFSGGYLRLGFDYKAFAEKAQDVELLAIQMQKRGTIEESEAILLLQDYQLARSHAPLIPDKIYQMREPKLNAIWAQRK